MKTFPVIFLLSFILFASCKKDEKKVTNHIHCDGLITDTLSTGNTAKIFMLNAFTPNNDGLNDIMRPIFQNVASFTFTIYDDYNDVVFTTSTPMQGYSNTINAIHMETYYYKIQATTNDGHQIGKCGELYKVACRPSNAPAFYFEDQLTQAGFTGTTLENIDPCP